MKWRVLAWRCVSMATQTGGGSGGLRSGVCKYNDENKLKQNKAKVAM